MFLLLFVFDLVLFGSQNTFVAFKNEKKSSIIDGTKYQKSKQNHKNKKFRPCLKAQNGVFLLFFMFSLSTFFLFLPFWESCIFWESVFYKHLENQMILRLKI